jgi:CRISPR-associated exonuclease Cas4
VAITPALRQLVIETATAIRAMLAFGKLPSPVNDARCKECSLKDICQPEAIADHIRQSQQKRDLFNPEE